MARTVSAILSPADKRAKVAELKGSIKSAKDNLKQIAAIRKDTEKQYTVVTKAHLAALKVNDKELAVAVKLFDGLNASLAALTTKAEAPEAV